MSHPIRSLKAHLSRVSAEGSMSDGDVVRVMSLTRQVIEGAGLQADYQLLNFYCNWCFHTALTHSVACWEMLARITDIFLSDDGTRSVDIPSEVSEVLSLKYCRHELIALYSVNDLPVFLFTSLSNWQGFGSQLLKELINKPIGFPPDLSPRRLRKAKTIFDSMTLKTTGREAMRVTKLVLTDSEKGHEGEVWWVAETRPTIRILGRLKFGETRADFEAD